MIDTRGLRLDQAPPIHLPFRLFLTAPWFAVAAGVLMVVAGDAALGSRWSPAALAATHLLTVGFLGQVMCGALLQMLPVIAVAPIRGVAWVGAWPHVLLSLGAGLMAGGSSGSGALPCGLTLPAPRWGSRSSSPAPCRPWRGRRVIRTRSRPCGSRSSPWW
jgi:hypothetical protein